MTAKDQQDIHDILNHPDYQTTDIDCLQAMMIVYYKSLFERYGCSLHSIAKVSIYRRKCIAALEITSAPIIYEVYFIVLYCID